MKRLAVIPGESIAEYLEAGYSEDWLRDYYNPCQFFDEVYLLSPLEEDNLDLLGMKVFKTRDRELKKRLKELKIDVVRAYGGYWSCAMACDYQIKDVPVVVSVHDTNPKLLFTAIKKADVVWCVSTAVRNVVLTKFNHPEKTWILPNRVNFDTMRPYSREECQDLDVQYPFRYRIFHVGRKTEQKNLDNLIKALKILGPDYCVIASGKGDADVYEQLAQQEGVHDRCFFIESIEQKELARYYSWVECMCTPSRWEGFGMVFTEALACGAVVVTSDIAPMNEFITHGDNGLLVKDYENPKAIAKMIQKACGDQEIRSVLKNNARKSVERFEKSHIDQLEAKYYARVLGREDKIMTHYTKALDWIRNNTIPEQGIIVNSKERVPYLEVTGYLIPTLLDAGELNLAEQYAEFLLYMQRPNGSFSGPDGREYIFDTGQALRGLNRAAERWERFKPATQRAADYLASSVQENGQIPAIYGDAISENVHVFVLPAMAEAAEVLNNPDYLQAAKKALHYYKNVSDILSEDILTHFFSYIIDGFIDMGEEEFVRPAVEKIFTRQKKDGSISAYPNVKWVCTTGLAQLGIVAYKLGMKEQAEKAWECVAKSQNDSGGFYGSVGRGAQYFQDAEISWANKFFLDAMQLKGFSKQLDSEAVATLNSDQWHEAIVSQPVEEVVKKIRSNQFPVWCQPFMEHSAVGDSCLEIGSGTGEISAILGLYGRQVNLLDYSQESIDYAKSLFEALELEGKFYCGDMFAEFPVSEGGVDWVFSSGVLEHYTDEEILSVMRQSVKVSRKGVMCLVPNRNAIFYRIGKHKMESEGKWAYGHEDPKLSMRPYFEQAGLKNIQEYSVGTYHALQFWGKDFPEVKQFLDSLSQEELKNLNQGYLLFTFGEKGDSKIK